MALQIRYIRNPIKKYTFLLVFTALLGDYFFSIDLGFFQLSIYRILILFSPLFFLYTSYETNHKLQTSKSYSYFRFLRLWLIYSVITLFWVQDLSSWIRAFSLLLCGCITSWFVGWYFTTKKDWINALKIIEIFALLFGIISLYEIITGNYMFISYDYLTYFESQSAQDSTIGFRIPIAVFNNPNNYSLFLLFSIYGSIALCKVKSTISGNVISLILVVFFIFLLITTQSRSGFIGFIVSLIPLVYLYLKRNANEKHLLLIIVSLFILATISYWIITKKAYYDALITIDTRTGSDQVRLNLIKNGLLFLVNSLFMGVGLGNIEYYMSTKAMYFTSYITNIHNWWMEILVSSGIFIFILYVIIYIKSLWKLLDMSLAKMDKDVMNISICFFCFLISFIIGSIGSSSLMNSEWLWPIMAIIMSFLNSDSDSILTN
jgi:teichuronic acid biosynthesis protein TuaE